jgi:alkylation response protein AidB-like acyl-CoA dehydrogenase
MEHTGSDVYKEYRQTMRRFARERVAPFAAIVDREQRPPIEALTAGLELGLPGLPYPEKFGGQAGDMFAQCIVVEEIAKVCATSALTVSTAWVMTGVVDYGNEAQQQEIIPPIVRGESRPAWALTEPKGGSDLMSTTTRATRTGDGWVLNGTKRFSTNGGWADLYLIFARTSEKRFGLFLVRKDDPGVSFGAPERKMGLRGSPTSDVILENCVLPESRLLGDPESGAQYISEMLLRSRVTLAAHAIGIAGGALAEAVRYTTEREQFGKPIATFQMLRGMVADMAIRVESGRAALQRAIELFEARDPSAKLHASIAKVVCSDAAMAVTTDAVQLHGGYGYLEDYPVERMMRDAKITQIWEGTNQIQRLLIAKAVYERMGED